MSRLVLSLAAFAVLAGCGIKKPLIAPKDIPAYERKREEKLRDRQEIPEAMLRSKGTV